MISILLAIRKNSKFFAKFMTGFLKNTADFTNIELLVMANKEDTWNQDLFELYHDKLKVFYEDKHIGKNGRHIFFNELAEIAEGDWLWHMCDDHYLLPGYDEYLTNYLKDYDSKMIYQVVPRVDNSGSISHLLSRGWYETTGRIGYHGNIDSYLNNVADRIVDGERILHPEHPILHDYTTNPEIMTNEHTFTEIDPNFKVYGIYSPETEAEVNKDAKAIYDALIGGGK